MCQSFCFNKVAALRPVTLLKKRLWRICFPVDFVKFIRAPLVKFIRPPLVAASVKHNFMLK